MSVTPTITRFCHDTWQLISQVQRVELGQDYLYLITEMTPFHPVSHICLIIRRTKEPLTVTW